MDTTAAAAAGAVTFLWLGMVLAVSFLETPLRFRAEGVTLPVGLAIGRIVFRALNVCEAVLAVVVVVLVATGSPDTGTVVATAASVALLAAQTGLVRPRLGRYSDRILAGEKLPRSRTHLWYVALELAKLAALVVLGVRVLGAATTG